MRHKKKSAGDFVSDKIIDLHEEKKNFFLSFYFLLIGMLNKDNRLRAEASILEQQEHKHEDENTIC